MCLTQRYTAENFYYQYAKACDEKLEELMEELFDTSYMYSDKSYLKNSNYLKNLYNAQEHNMVVLRDVLDGWEGTSMRDGKRRDVRECLAMTTLSIYEDLEYAEKVSNAIIDEWEINIGVEGERIMLGGEKNIIHYGEGYVDYIHPDHNIDVM